MTAIETAVAFADWLTARIYYAHDETITKAFRAFEKKYGPNGTFNFGNYLRANKRQLRIVLNHPKLPAKLKKALERSKGGGWLAG